MTIRHLKVFIKVSELNSISKAAEALTIAQPSVSETIKELENYYGVMLFNRENRKITLTKEGEILLAKAKETVNSFDEFESLANKEDLNPIIRIGATMTFGAFVIPNYLTKLEKELPNSIPKFYIDKPMELEHKVMVGSLDFAFQEGLINSKSLKAIHIGDDELIAICGLEYPAPEKLKLVDLVEYELLLREVGNPSRRMLDYQLAIKGIKLGTPRVESVSNNVIVSMAINNHGIGILPRAAAKRSIELGLVRQIQLDTPLKRPLYLISQKNKKFNGLLKKAYVIAQNMLEKKSNTF